MADFGSEMLTRAVAGDGNALSDLLVSLDSELRKIIDPQIGRKYRPAFSVEDVLQVTYLEAFLHIGRFRPTSGNALRNWLVRIAENNLRDAIRELDCQKRPPRHRQIVDVGGTESYTGLLNTLGATQSTPSLHAFRQEIRDDINAALRELPRDYERVVRMFDLEGCGAAEIAEQMGRSTGAVHMLKARAHEQLHALLGQSTNYFSHGD